MLQQRNCFVHNVNRMERVCGLCAAFNEQNSQYSNILQSLDISPKFGVFKELLNADDSFLTQALSSFFLT